MNAVANLLPQLRRQFEDMVSRFMASDAGQRVIAWNDQLGERDRLMLRILAVFLGGALAFMLLVSPALRFADRAQGRLQEERELLGWLQSNASAVRAPSGGATERSGSVLSVVTDTAHENNVQVRRFEPDGDTGVRVWIDAAQFNALIKWVYTLEETHGIHVAEMNIERGTAAGMVSARLTLRG